MGARGAREDKVKHILFAIMAVSWLLGPRVLFAEEGGEQPVVVEERGGEVMNPGEAEVRHPGRHDEEAQRLRRLKQEDPEAFRAAIEERRGEVKEKLENLKETNPEAYERLLDRKRSARRHRLDRLREEDPEAFRRWAESRRDKLSVRLEKVKENDPQKYEELTAKRKDWRKEKLEHLQVNNPEAYERFMTKHPKWEEHPELGPPAWHKQGHELYKEKHETLHERLEDADLKPYEERRIHEHTHDAMKHRLQEPHDKVKPRPQAGGKGPSPVQKGGVPAGGRR
ncbi:MAG: hypothetical protein HYY14_00935 [Candidatus Omnitrophica bacterium]|nr:hypothetical protein [Candidatus Omnitrophota bacterium]